MFFSAKLQEIIIRPIIFIANHFYSYELKNIIKLINNKEYFFKYKLLTNNLLCVIFLEL